MTILPRPTRFLEMGFAAGIVAPSSTEVEVVAPLIHR